MSDSLPVNEAKELFVELVERVESTGTRVGLTINGRAVAVLMSAVELASLEDTCELISDPVAMAEIRESRRELDRGHVVTAAELIAKYGRR